MRRAADLPHRASTGKDVAERFNLTRDNAPRHPSNCTAEWVQEDMERGVSYFIIEDENHVAGCVALMTYSLENPDPTAPKDI